MNFINQNTISDLYNDKTDKTYAGKEQGTIKTLGH